METDRVRLFKADAFEIEALRFCGHETTGGAMFAALAREKQVV
jgi:hypothetical protein